MNIFKKIFKAIVVITTLLSLLVTSTSISQAYSEQHSRTESTFRARKTSMMDGGGYGSVNISNFSVNMKGKTAYTHNSKPRYHIERDYASHNGYNKSGSYWKLKRNNKTIASLTKNGEVIKKYGKNPILP